MDSFTLRVFQTEVASQCRFALIAAEDIDRALNALTASHAAERERSHATDALLQATTDPDERVRIMKVAAVSFDQHKAEVARQRDLQTRVWAGIQAFLVATVNVVKLLEPGRAPRGRSSWTHTRHPDLKQSLNLPNTWVLLDQNTRDLRNIFEHYDEYLDRIGGPDNPNSIVIDQTIGDVSQGIKLQGFPPDQMSKVLYRSFNPQTGDLHFWDKTLNLRVLCAELRTLAQTAEEKTNPSW